MRIMNILLRDAEKHRRRHPHRKPPVLTLMFWGAPLLGIVRTMA
jgi:hypothetical protein